MVEEEEEEEEEEEDEEEGRTRTSKGPSMDTCTASWPHNSSPCCSSPTTSRKMCSNLF